MAADGWAAALGTDVRVCYLSGVDFDDSWARLTTAAVAQHSAFTRRQASRLGVTARATSGE